jgi:hypothetical protein
MLKAMQTIDLVPLLVPCHLVKLSFATSKRIFIQGKALSVVILLERNFATEEFRASLNDAKE